MRIEQLFSSYILAEKALLYKKGSRKMLMKLTLGNCLLNFNRNVCVSKVSISATFHDLFHRWKCFCSFSLPKILLCNFLIKSTKAACKKLVNWLQELISPTCFEQHCNSKILYAAFLHLHFLFELPCCIISHDFRRCFIKKPSHDFRSLQNQ